MGLLTQIRDKLSTVPGRHQIERPTSMLNPTVIDNRSTVRVTAIDSDGPYIVFRLGQNKWHSVVTLRGDDTDPASAPPFFTTWEDAKAAAKIAASHDLGQDREASGGLCHWYLRYDPHSLKCTLRFIYGFGKNGIHLGDIEVKWQKFGGYWEATRRYSMSNTHAEEARWHQLSPISIGNRGLPGNMAILHSELTVDGRIEKIVKNPAIVRRRAEGWCNN